MATLDRWRAYLKAPKTLAFPKLGLMGRDHAPMIVEGSGEVRLNSLTRTQYTLMGSPKDITYAFSEFRHQQDNPYDDLKRFRLVGTDSDGIEWTLGWTVPRVEIGDGDVWTFSGELQGLIPKDNSDTVSRESCTEVIYVVPVNHPMALAMGRFVLTKHAERRHSRQYEIEILTSQVRFSYEPDAGVLTIAALHSTDLPGTYAENWLGEPLRILFGQLVFPRLVARNLGGGRTIVFIRPSPGLIREARWAALWESEAPTTDKEAFWRLYAQLLVFISQARDENGHRNFESNKVTKLYEEIIQAASGSRWVWALTFASSIEGLVNMLERPGQRRPDADEVAAADLIRQINAWTGDERLKQNAVGAVRRATNTTAAYTLRGLLTEGVITKSQLDAWSTIRNSVMHGTLVSPYSSADEDRKLISLSAMMHALTREVVRRAIQSSDQTTARNA